MLYIFLALFSILTKFNPEVEIQQELTKYIGMDLKAVYETFGVPDKIQPWRNEYSAQNDNVIFYYNDHIHLFFYDNTVCQIRYDYRYQKEFIGLKMGMDRERVTAVRGAPHYTEKNTDSLYEKEDFFIYNLDYKQLIRLRLDFKNNKLNDAYIYKADF